MTSVPTSRSETVPYRDPSRPTDERVEDLLGRMTVDEKLAQLGSRWVFEFSSTSELTDERVVDLCPDGIGQVTRVSGASDHPPAVVARLTNQIQRQLVEQTRLGIPAIIHEEICSGFMGRGATAFPQAIGVAASFDPELNLAIADSIRRHMRGVGAHQGLSPVLDVSRDPRWGRTEETYGEDPHLVASMGSAFIRGLQGGLQGMTLSDGVVATAKHFVGYGASEGGLNWAPAHIGARELREVHLHPFEAAVKSADLRSIMNGYHELDGVPCAANHDLMRRILREEWGFDGLVVSDYFSVDQLDVYHHVATGKSQAASIALTMGIDSELPSTDCYGQPLLDALDGGLLSHDVVDESVRRVLATKFELGLFEHPYVDEERARTIGNTDESRALAARAAARTLVLLRNDGTLPLPLDPSLKVAVIGPNSDVPRNLFGGYSYAAHVESLLEMRDKDNVFDIPMPDDFRMADLELTAPSVLDGLRSRLGGTVTHARGCGIADDDRSGIAEAVCAAEAADVVVLVVGDKAGLTDDCTSGETRDRSSLDLPGVQEELAKAIFDTGTPVVTVLVVGRPCGSVELHERSAAVLMAWLPGEAGAQAIADAVVGVTNPGGKLPITFPRHVGQIPVFYGHKISGGRSHWKGDYVDGPVAPLYPFGFGSSYTTFELTDQSVQLASDGRSVRVDVTVTNTGTRSGDEVVQVYFSDPVASVTRPVHQLVAFVRLTVEPGDTRSVEFEIPVGRLGFHTNDAEFILEAGVLEFQVGTSATQLVPAGSVAVEGGVVEKAFEARVIVR